MGGIFVKNTRSPNRDKAFEIYKSCNGNISSKDLSKKLNEKVENIYRWKRIDEWDKKIHKKVGAPKNNKNAVGNSGGAKKGNLNNLKHGDYYDPAKHLEKDFLKKYIPTATKKIIQETAEAGLNALDILWSSIQIQWAAIVRSQKIMNVKNNKDINKVLKKESWGKTSSKEYEIQFADARQAQFLTAQSKAMVTLQNLINKYDELLNKDRKLANEEQKARIEKLKAEVKKIAGDDKNKNDGLKLVVDYGDNDEDN